LADWVVDPTGKTKTPDYLDGKGGNDELHGRWGNDYLVGGSGADKLWGDAGNDIEFGGTGRDQFMFSWQMGNDVVKDFTIAGVNGNAANADKVVINSLAVSNQSIYNLIANAEDDSSNLTSREKSLLTEWGLADPAGNLIDGALSGTTNFTTQWEWKAAADVDGDGRADAILHLYSDQWVKLANERRQSRPGF